MTYVRCNGYWSGIIPKGVLTPQEIMDDLVDSTDDLVVHDFEFTDLPGHPHWWLAEIWVSMDLDADVSCSGSYYERGLLEEPASVTVDCDENVVLEAMTTRSGWFTLESSTDIDYDSIDYDEEDDYDDY